MKVAIENYRGWQIFFDTDNEMFYSYSDQWDKEKEKKSYSAAKKVVDDFIKDNQAFKPFYVETAFGDKSNQKLKIIGIRKDELFVFENQKGDKEQVNVYYYDKYTIYDDSNDIYKLQIESIDKQIDILRGKRKEILSNCNLVTLAEYKKQLLNK